MNPPLSWRGIRRPIGWTCALAIGYLLLQELGLRVAFAPPGASAFWPAAGFAVGVLSRFPARRWPPFLAGLIVVGVLDGVAHGTGVTLLVEITFAHAAQAATGAWVLGRRQRLSSTSPDFAGAWVLLRLVPAALLAAAVGAALITAAEAVGGSAAPLGLTAWVWFAANTLGILAVIPAVNALADRSWMRNWSTSRITEAALLVGAEVLLAGIVFGSPGGSRRIEQWPYLLIPGLLWAVMRFGPSFTAILAAALTAVLVWRTAIGDGPFAQPTEVLDRMLAVQTFCVAAFGSLLAIAQVIAGRQAAEQIATERSAAMALAMEGIAFLDPEGRYVRVNPAYAANLATTPDLLLGINGETNTHPDDLGTLANAYQLMLETGKATAEARGIRADGTVFYEEVTLVAERDAAGALLGHHCFMHNISERREATDQLNEFFELSRDLLCVVGTDGSFRRVNPAWTRLLGYSTADLMSQTVSDLVHPDDMELTCAGLTKIIARLPGVEFENRCRCLDGSYRWLRWSATLDPSGTRIYAVAHDVTTRKQTAKSLTDDRDAARDASRMKSQFLAAMSHEIRTPMNGVIGLSDLLADTELDVSQRRYIDGVRTAGAGLLTVIDEILDFSKVEAGSFVLDDIRFDMVAMVTDLALLMGQIAESKDLRLDIELDSALPAIVRGDPGRLRQILLNLVGNAIKFTETGGVTLRARLGTNAADVASADRLMVCFDVTDTGVGIGADALERIFEPFQQESASTTRTHGGTGLGLAISQRTAEAMGGGVVVTSESGTGTTFTVTVELLSVPDGEWGTGGPTTEAEDPIEPASYVERGLILLVEDNEINQIVALEILRKLGYTVELAVNGIEALAAAEQHVYQAILMDCQLPGMDGYAVTALLRQRPATARTPIIAMTANAFAEDRVRCIEAGMDDYLPKPIRAHDIDATLIRWTKPTATTDEHRSWSEPSRAIASVRERIIELIDVGTPTDVAFVRKITESFLTRLPTLLANLDLAIQTDNLVDIAAHAHTLNGASSNLGALNLSGICGTIEDLARQERPTEIPSQHARLGAAADQASAELSICLTELLIGTPTPS
jgi:PAS domain S-box-containing protein